MDYWTTIIFKRWIDVIKLNGQCSSFFHMKLLTIAWNIERSQPRRETFICATSLWTWHRRKRMRQGPTGRVPRALSESTGWQIDTGKYHIFWRRKHASSRFSLYIISSNCWQIVSELLVQKRLDSIGLRSKLFKVGGSCRVLVTMIGRGTWSSVFALCWGSQ